MRAPSATFEYMLYQALLGAWPSAGRDDDVSGADAGLCAARRRARASRKPAGSIPTSAYEAGLADFHRAHPRSLGSADFLSSTGNAGAAHRRCWARLNSLSQITLKATMPGVPDFYQGTEFWDLSLVDPDNRRPVDFAGARQVLASVDTPDWQGLAQNWSRRPREAGLDPAPAEAADRTRRRVRARRLSAAASHRRRTATTSLPLRGAAAATPRLLPSQNHSPLSRKAAGPGRARRISTARSI